MDDNQTQINQPQQPMPAGDQVSFPNSNVQQKQESGKNGVIKWVIVIVGVIAIVAGGIFFIMRTSDDAGDSVANATPTARSGVLNSFDAPEPTVTEEEEPSPTPTPEPADRAELSVEVLNGTGTPGDAGMVASILEDLGFEDTTAANAETQEETETTLTYSEKIDPATIDEIVAELEKIFTEVVTREGTIAADFDIRIVTGEKLE